MDVLRWTNARGQEETREVVWSLDFRKFRGVPGYALLLIAANTHLSVRELRWLLETEGVERSKSWIQRRRWLFQQPTAVNAPGRRANADGKDARAIQLMQEHPRLSVRELVRLLGKCGIRRGRDWVMRNRCG